MSLELDSPPEPQPFIEAPGVTPPQTPEGRAAFLTDVLVELGFAERAAVDEAVEHSRLVGRVPEDLLLENAAITSEQLSRAIAERTGLAFVDIDAFSVDRGAQELIDTGTAHRYRAAPIAIDVDGALVVALADPLDALAVSDIGEITKSEVRPVVATEAGLDALLSTMPARATRPPASDEPDGDSGAWLLNQAISSTEPAEAPPEPQPEVSVEPPKPPAPTRGDDEIPDLDRILGELAAVSGEEPLPAVAPPPTEPEQVSAADADEAPTPEPEASEPAFEPLPPPVPISFTEDEAEATDHETFMLEPARERQPLAATEPDEPDDDQPAATPEEPQMDPFTPEPEPEFEAAFTLDAEEVAAVEDEAEVVSLPEPIEPASEPFIPEIAEPEPEPAPIAIIDPTPIAAVDPEPEPVAHAAKAEDEIEALAVRIEELERKLIDREEELDRLRDRASRASRSGAEIQRTLADLEAAIAVARQAADEVAAAEAGPQPEPDPTD